MKLLLLSPSAKEYGGAEKSDLTFGKGAQIHGLEVHFAFPPSNHHWLEQCVKHDIKYHPLNIADGGPNYPIYRSVFALLANTLRCILLLKTIKPDRIFISVPSAQAALGPILACAVLSAPVAVLFHWFPLIIPVRKSKIPLYRWAKRQHQQWIVRSCDNRRNLCESFGLSEDDIKVIYVGALMQPNLGNYGDATKLRSLVRQELGLEQSARIALTVARLNIDKGYPVLIQTIPHLLAEFPDLRFVWAGNGLERQKIMDLLQLHGIENKVILLGHIDNVSRILQAADLFIFPTLHEGGQSAALTEAMASGVPFVASRANGIPEIVEHRVHGLLCEPNNSTDLLEAIRWALSNHVSMMEMAGQARQQAENFTAERMINETLNLLLNMPT